MTLDLRSWLTQGEALRAASLWVVLSILLGGCSLHSSTHVTQSPSVAAVVATPNASVPTGTPIETPRPHSPTVAATPTVSPTPTPSKSPVASPIAIDDPLVLRGARAAITSLAWSPDGTLLAAAGANRPDESDHTIRLRQADGTFVATLRGHTNLVTSLAWSPDGQTLASASLDGTVRLWSADGTFKTMLTGSDQSMGAVLSLAWSPDGSILAVGYIGSPNGLKGYVGLYQADGEFIRTMPESVDTGGKFLNLGWSPDGGMLAAGAVGYRIWRPDGTDVGSIYIGGTPQWGFGWAPDSKSLAIGDENGYVGLFSPDGTGIENWQQNGSVDSLAFAPDGSVIAVHSNSYLLRLLAVGDHSGQPMGTLQPTGAPSFSSNIAWSSAALVASSAADNKIYVFDPSGSQVAVLTGCDGPVESLAWSTSGVLAAGSSTGNVCLWPPIPISRP